MDSSQEDEDTIHIFDFPDVVIQDHLFPLLRLNDLLRLRRVSKTTKNLAEAYIRVHHVNNPREIEITEGDDADGGNKSISDFLAMGIPASRIYLNNKSVKFFKHKDIPEFLKLYADKITHLRVHHFSAFANKAEEPFFSALTSLTHLELEEIDAREWRCDFKYVVMEDKEIPRPPCPITKNFKNLKTIKFGHIEPFSKHDHGYWVDIIECCCEHLEYIGHPLYDHPLPPQNNPLGLPLPPGVPLPPMMPMLSNNGAFRCAERVMDWRHETHPDKPNLQFYDLQNFKDTPHGGGSSFDFIFFLRHCYERGVKLLNVDAELFMMLGPSDEKQFKETVVPIMSIKNLNRSLFQRELPNLQSVVITETSKCTYFPFWMEHGRKPFWPKLKTLDMTVDSKELEELVGLNVGVQVVAELYDFLFTDLVRPELTELALRFDEQVTKSEHLPSPRLGDVKTSCPNLKRLTLVNWTGTNKALSKFWSGLEYLEDLVLQNCRELGNVAFVGEKTDCPTFLKLKNLKKLTMSGLEVMPKVTDTLFNLVIRHMKLKQLFLRSEEPIKSITTNGIKCLLTGEFASSIEKFPFREWSLVGVAEDEFRRIELQFRSYYMI